MELRQRFALGWCLAALFCTLSSCSLLKAPPAALAPVAQELLVGDGAVVPDFLNEADFERLHESRQGVEYVKLVVVRSDLSTTDDDRIYFFDPRVYPLHIEFVRRTGLIDADLVQAVQTETWKSPERRFFFANLSRYQDGEDKTYVLETFEQDYASAALVADVVRLTGSHSFLTDKLLYKPNSLAQVELAEDLAALNIATVENHQLTDQQPFAVLNRGRPVVGQLRVVESLDPMEVQLRLFEPTDIVVLQTVPNDITRVSGIITTQPSTPLAHVNLRAMTWGIPNVMIRDALSFVWSEGMEDAWVHLSVDDEGLPELRHATAAETARVLEQRVYQTHYQLPAVDLEETKLRALSSLRSADVMRVGAKAANLGEMTHLLKGVSAAAAGRAVPSPESTIQLPSQVSWPFVQEAIKPLWLSSWTDLQTMNVKARAAAIFNGVEIPPGVAVPFGVYERFIQDPANEHIRVAIQALLDDPTVENNAFERRRRLAEVRQLIEQGKVSEQLRELVLDGVAQEVGEGDVFVRSSTNSEDLLGFNGAGLYDSFGPISGQDAIIEAMLRVWASVWNLRAYDARRDFGIDHASVYPAALIQAAVVKPDIAGVMVTRDIFSGGATSRAYLNANPGPGANVAMTGMRPEQIYVDLVNAEVEHLSVSESAQGQQLLSDPLARRLALVGAFLEAHFSELLGREELPQDVEWLVVGETVYLVQSRPYAPSM